MDRLANFSSACEKGRGEEHAGSKNKNSYARERRIAEGSRMNVVREEGSVAFVTFM